MVDEPSGVPDWVTFITAVRNQMLLKAGGDGTGTSEAWLKFTSYDGTITAQINFNGIDGSFYINGSQSQINLTSQISFIIGGTPRLVISTGGDVGIGNTNPSDYHSPADNLVIGTSGDNGLTIVSNATNGTSHGGTICFADGTTGGDQYSGFIDYQHSTNAMRFGTNGGSPRLTISSGGSLLVKTNATSGIGNGDIGLDNGALRGGVIRARNAADNAYKALIYLDQNDAVQVGTAATGLNISSGGLATFSNGIKFGTGDTLDAYEEDTYQPTLFGGTTAGTNPPLGAGNYTVIGNICYLSIRFNNATLTNASGAITISLPFAAKSGVSGQTSADINVYNFPFSTTDMNMMNCAGGNAYGLASRNNTTWVDWNVPTGVNTGIYINFSVTYIIN